MPESRIYRMARLCKNVWYILKMCLTHAINPAISLPIRLSEILFALERIILLAFYESSKSPLKMKKISLIFLHSLLILNVLSAQSKMTSDTTRLEEVVISANKTEESRRNVAFQIQTITAKQIQFQNNQTLANVLESAGAAVVQRSQQGGGSPMLRGYEASRVLLVVDGVRMNNLIYRAGHLQNIMTVDPSLLERAEVLYGPSSTVYGSDALGGTIHFMTKKPKLRENTEGGALSANAALRYGSANQEKTAHLNFNIGSRRFAALTALSYSDFGDLRMGTKSQALDTLWGLRPFYQTRINGRDTILANADKFVQKSSGYQQYDALQKFLFQQNDRVNHLLNLQFSTSSNLPRYDRLTDLNAARTRLNQAEWYYGPQERLLASYVLTVNNLGFFDKLTANASYQNIEESRHTRGWQAANLTSRVENVQVMGATIDFLRSRGNQDLRAGVDAQYSAVKSTAFTTHKTTGAIGVASTRYPDGDNSQANTGLYLTHTWRIGNKWVLNDGFRVQNILLRSTFATQQFYKLPFTEIKQNNWGWSGNLGLIYHVLPDVLRLSAMASTGFRSPNVDDLAKIFDTNTADKLVVVPNPDVKPEKTYNLDLGIKLRVGEKLVWENTFFLTRMQDAIVINDFQYNGQDSIVYDGVKSRVRAPQNAENATITGFSSQVKWRLLTGMTASASLNLTKGEVQNKERKAANLDHVPPTFGRVGVAYDCEELQAEAYCLFNGWKRIADYRLGAEDNEQYATTAGMPSWWTLNLKAAYALSKNLTLQAGIENVLDIQYRVFASGIHAAGRNVYGTLRASF
jgi:hemoglobin/transferrin/lactoferrin receptor protein